MDHSFQPLPDGQSQNQQPSMKWHNFLIYFGLWAGAFSNLYNAAMQATGAVYAGHVNQIYEQFPRLQILDILFAVLLAGIAVFCVFTRFSLAKFRRKGPMLLMLLYLCNVSVNVLYPITTALCSRISVMNAVVQLLPSNLVSLAVIWANYVYYKKRAALFVN